MLTFWLKIFVVYFALTREVKTIDIPKLPSIGKLISHDTKSTSSAPIVAAGNETTTKSSPIADKNQIDNSSKLSIVPNIDKITNKIENTISNVSTQIGTDIKKVIDCYNELGCFPNDFPWFSALRPFPKPMKPTEIDTKIYLYTSKKPNEKYTVTLWDNITIDGSDFDPNRNYTAFITHGFAANGNNTWLSDLKDAYLKKRDANVFIVDWGKGASNWNYLQVGANTRVVGAELARFGKYLVEQKGLNTSKIHLMGHSLGAHISSYMAKALNKVARLTAFDPAQPGFEGCPNQVRLAKTDADFVDVLHTNSRPIIPLLGFGLILPTGHVDYYLNGGLIQPGCTLPPVDQIKIQNIADLAKYPVEVISEWVACSHGKSYLYYTESLLNDYCTMWGKSAGILGTAFDIGTLGVSDKLLSKFTTCNLDKCSPIGLETDEYPARGIFIVSTHAGSPYCFDDPKIKKSMEEQRSRQLEQTKSGVTEKNSISKTLSKTLGTVIG